MLRWVARHAPHAAHVVCRVGHWTYKRNASFHLQRQDVVVLHQHERLGRNAACLGAVLGRIGYFLCAERIAVFIGVAEKPQIVFHLQHPAARFVDTLFGYLAFLDGFLHSVEETARHHVHVSTGIHGKDTCFLERGYSVGVHLCYGVIVGNYHSLESPLLAQHVFNEPLVGRCGYAVYCIERSHYRSHSCFNGSLVRGQVFVEHLYATYVGAIIIPTRLRRTVKREMLEACHYAGIGFLQVASLVSAHVGTRHGCSQVRVFAVAFGNTSPPCVAAYIYHRAECPSYTVCTCFFGCHLSHALNGRGVPTASQRQRYGKDSLVAMYNVGAGNQRYA